MEDKVKRYEKIEFLGEGQFATVYKAKDTKCNERIVAVKKIKLGSKAEAKDGINRTALREIKLLQELEHPNIIGLLDVFGHKSNVSLVFDFMDTDLEIIINDKDTVVFTPANIKAYMVMTLQGLEYLHMNWILHRDLKPNNLLVDSHGCLKIGDFGLAKFYGSPSRIYTHQVVTRWYRAPELLFGSRNYGTGVDMWAVGCILAELLLRVPLLAGDSDLDQLSKIFQAFGTPTLDSWPGVEKLADYVQFKMFPGTPLSQIFTAAGEDLLLLLQELLSLNPLKRANCTQALQLPYFSNSPAPSKGTDLPLPEAIKEKTRRDTAPKRKMLDKLDEGNTMIKKLIF